MTKAIGSIEDLLAFFNELANARMVLYGQPQVCQPYVHLFRVVKVFETGHLMMELITDEDRNNRIFGSVQTIGAFRIMDETMLDEFITANKERLVSSLNALL